MGILKAIVSHFKQASSTSKSGKFGLLSPLIASGDFVKTTIDMFQLLETNPNYKATLLAKEVPSQKSTAAAYTAYQSYIKALPNIDFNLEKKQPLVSIVKALEAMHKTVELIEDHFKEIFGATTIEKPEEQLKSSSLMVIGYLEQVDHYCTWASAFVEHLTASAKEMIPPFRTKMLTSESKQVAEFAMLNLYKWHPDHNGFLNHIKDMAKQGKSLALQTSEGTWIDDYASDDHFSETEQNLLQASLRSPITMGVSFGINKIQALLNLLESRKEWLTAKIVMEQAKLRGLDENSPEYKRIQKACDHYADLVSRYEQHIERIKA